jgi:proline iminopeptidase
MRERPTLLLLHGGPGFDHSLFKPWFDRFADTHQVVYLDHRGQGRSDQRDDDGGWDLDTWADDVARFCATLEIERPHVFGNSFGGMVALHYAARHPDGPAKLVLSSTAARMDQGAVADAFEQLGGPHVRDIAERFWSDPKPENQAEYFAHCFPLYTQRSANLTEGRERARMHTGVMAHFIEGEQRTMDLRPDLPAVRCPTLVLAGALDPVCPPVNQEELVAGLPADLVRYELFDECGHGTYRDEPERTEQVLRDFLAD